MTMTVTPPQSDVVQIVTPRDEAHWLEMRQKDVTSTEIAALFNLSPWLTEFELWHRKASGEAVPYEATQRMVWGTRLQDSIAQGVAADQGWTVRKKVEYIRHPALRIGASFDFEVLTHKDGPGLLEVKNVDSLAFRGKWSASEDGGIEAPAQYELQLQQQLMLSGYAWGCIAALVGGNEVRLLYRKADAQVHAAIRRKAEAFWRSVHAGAEPTPDYARDAEVITRLYSYAQPGNVLDASRDTNIASLVSRYLHVSKEVSDLTEVRDGLKAELLTRIGDAEKVVGEGWTISAGIVGESQVSYTRKAFRSFRVTAKRASKTA